MGCVPYIYSVWLSGMAEQSSLARDMPILLTGTGISPAGISQSDAAIVLLGRSVSVSSDAPWPYYSMYCVCTVCLVEEIMSDLERSLEQKIDERLVEQRDVEALDAGRLTSVSSVYSTGRPVS